MSLVRQVLQRVIESARYAAPAAKFCISVIEVCIYFWKQNCGKLAQFSSYESCV